MHRRDFIRTGGATAVALLAGQATSSTTQGSSSLQAMIDQASDGTASNPTVIDGNGATFRVEETCRISNRHHLTLTNLTLIAETDGAQATPWKTHLWPRNRTHFKVDEASSHIDFVGVTVQGPNPNAGMGVAASVTELEAQAGWTIDEASTHVNLSECSVFDVYGDFVTVATAASDVMIDRCMFNRNGRQGIAVTDGKRVTVQRCDIRNVRRSMFDVEPNAIWAKIDQITFAENTLGDYRLKLFASKGKAAQITNIAYVRNQMESAGAMFYVESKEPVRRSGFKIEDNLFRVMGSPVPAFQFWRVDGIQFNRNGIYLPSSRNMTALRFSDCTNVSLAGNRFDGAAKDVWFEN